jgi:acyl carrier protein
LKKSVHAGYGAAVNEESNMGLDRDEIKLAIRAKVVELAGGLGMDAAGIGDDEVIPATGYLDSAAILELVVWYETAYDFPLQQREINIDNLGSINAMADFLLARRGR